MYFPTSLAAITTLVDARNSGDIDTALACYEPDATIIAQPGLILSGLDEVRTALVGFFALKPVLTVEHRQIIEGATTSLHLMRWRLQGTAENGEAVDLSGCTTDVLRKQPDGGWLLAIDNPWGTNLMSADALGN